MTDSIERLLWNFNSLDALKNLFLRELNYDRANTSLPIRDLPAGAVGEFLGDPLLLAEHDQFKVIYAQHTAILLREPQRALVNPLLELYPYALFVFSDVSQKHWHFVNVKYEREARRRRVFRRITVEAGSDRVRTSVERLSMLDLETLSRDLIGIPPLSIQHRHDQAFDAEAVTREFYREYETLFRHAETSLNVLPEERRPLFAQRLFNRLMFIVFLERKNWMRFNGRTDYLRALWEDYTQHGVERGETSFYLNRLSPVFFSALNYPANLRAQQGTYFGNFIGDVPYLNGGLFEQENDDDNGAVQIDDAVFRTAITDLFYRYNFTIAESTPLDIEVAVDPEMLGKIFEELVTGRHESGSYYTPKLVVSFMCREGLKGFLRASLPRETSHTIEHFVDEYDATRLIDPEAALQALQRVTVCDPACGSGAYLLGMMQELLLLRQSLFTTRQVDPRSMYERKLEIIKRNIYGVDIDPFAVGVARLRLWLSLIVDYDIGREGAQPPLLPNLDYKIEVGDSLLGSDPRQLNLANTLIDEYRAAKDALFQPEEGRNKQELRAVVQHLESEISTLVGEDTHSGFPWSVRFAEVFRDGGFDIVVANPPYVHAGLITAIKPALRQRFPEAYLGTADLYTYFYARAIQMLRPSGGMLVFISSNKWLRAGYGAKLRTLLTTATQLETVIDFGDLPVFGAIAYPVIVVARKQTSDDKALRVLTPKNLDRLDDLRAQVDDEAINVLPATLGASGWSFGDEATQQYLGTMRTSGVPLGEYVKGQLFYGIKTGLNEAFVINGATQAALVSEDPRSAEVIKPFLRGRDVKRWRLDFAEQYLLRVAHGDTLMLLGYDARTLSTARRRQLVRAATDDGSGWRALSATYPAIADFMQPFQEAASRRQDKGDFWWELRPCDYYWAFARPKILFPDIAGVLSFTMARNEVYCVNTAYIMPSDDMFLLGVLNSTVVNRFYGLLSTQIRGGFIRTIRQYVEQIPIPNAPQGERNVIAELAQVCMDKRGVGCESQEQEINERVAALYGVPIEVTA